MEIEDNSQPPTQPVEGGRTFGGHGSGIGEIDLLDVICILAPSTPAAHQIVKANMLQNPQHVIPNHDLIDGVLDDSLEQSRNIALRISSDLKSLKMGFVFGRVAESCDIILRSGRPSPTISRRHFRIYMKGDGVMMLQNTSSNGTVVDGTKLSYENPELSSRIIGNGSSIILYEGGGSVIEFVVRIPGRREHQRAYHSNLRRYLEKSHGAKPLSVLANPENTYGMKWNGGSQYNVVGVVGHGAFATVYKIADQRDGTAFAAKELNTSKFIKNGIMDIKFDNEIRIMKDLRHDNIVKYVDYYHHEEWIYLIMELVPHGELLTYLNKYGPLQEPFVQIVARQISRALAFLHNRGITHRDIKPDNILVAQEDPLKVKLSDFGLSKSIADNETFLKTFCGTLLYCAPEIYPDYMSHGGAARGKRSRPKDMLPKKYSNRVDMWSFGAVLFHLLCKQAPFTAGRGQDKATAMLESIMQTPVNFSLLGTNAVSGEGQDFIGHLLNIDPTSRPPARDCLQHPWISQLVDPTETEEEDLGHVVYTEHGLPLTTVDELDEESQPHGAEVDYPILNPDDFSDVRKSKRQRTALEFPAKGAVDDPVHLRTLPHTNEPREPARTQTEGRRLFGEVTASLLKSSGVFGNPSAMAAGDSEGSDLGLQQGMEDIGFDDKAVTGMEPGLSQLGEADESAFSTTSLPKASEPAPNPSSAPSLLGAERGIKDLNMASPEEMPSEVTTSDPHYPTTPKTRELTPSSNHESHSGVGIVYDSVGARAEEELSTYISLGVPNIPEIRDLVQQSDAKQAADATQTAEQPHAVTFAGQGSPKASLGESSKSKSFDTPEKIDRRINLPPIESLHPALDVPKNLFAKPKRRFGKLSTLPGSLVDLTVYIEHHNTYWGHGADCKPAYPDKTDPRIPRHVFQVMFHATDMNEILQRKEPWWTATGIRTIIASRAPGGILVNGVHLQTESEQERCAYYGKIYTGDIITVFPLKKQPGAFLKFKVEINYGDSAKTRPENEPGFQVRREINHHRKELARRESRKSSRDQGKQAAVASGGTTAA